MSTTRTERRWALAVLNGLAVSVALITFGCGSTDEPQPPEAPENSAPRNKAASTSFDASVSDAPADQSAVDDQSAAADQSAVADQTAAADQSAVADQSAATDHSAAADEGAGATDAAREASVDGAIHVHDAAAETPVAEAGPHAPSGPAVCGFKACAPGAPCPDLIVDVDDLRASIMISSRTFAPTDCAVVEGCIEEPGTRRLLRFDTGTANIGTADLVVGDPTVGACFQFSQCHQHYHFEGFSQYTLYKTDGRTVAATGHKQSFCLEDVEQYQPAPAPDPAKPFTCTSQGLHVGWEDIYPNDIDCQWVDITGVPAGNYLLKVAVNTAGYLPESNYANDSAMVPVTIP